jgi:hypothetical protein
MNDDLDSLDRVLRLDGAEWRGAVDSRQRDTVHSRSEVPLRRAARRRLSSRRLCAAVFGVAAVLCVVALVVGFGSAPRPNGTNSANASSSNGFPTHAGIPVLPNLPPAGSQSYESVAWRLVRARDQNHLLVVRFGYDRACERIEGSTVSASARRLLVGVMVEPSSSACDQVLTFVLRQIRISRTILGDRLVVHAATTTQ